MDSKPNSNLKVFCQHCGQKLPANQDANFCFHCGARLSSESDLIGYYFHLGYSYDVITHLLRTKHNIDICVRTLKRKLGLMKLKRKGNSVDEHNLRAIIRNEAQGCGSQYGYRKMWHTLRIKHHLHVPRTLVARILHDLDPDASKLRKKRKLRRREYRSHGPNQCWHIDGYDKLKPYGFPIHGGIDGFSRKVLWLEVTRSNNNPNQTAKFYLDCVKRQRGCPLQTRTDLGSENGITAAMQCYLRSNDDAPFSGDQAHIYGTSTLNQRIENWWSHLKKSCTDWWIRYFKDLVECGKVDLTNEMHTECLWFCFHGILQNALDEMKDYWNTHRIRPSRHDTVAGVPDILFFLPESCGGVDCSIEVSREKLLELETEIQCDSDGEENIYQEYFHYLMDHLGLLYPTNYNDAFLLFLKLTSIA